MSIWRAAIASTYLLSNPPPCSNSFVWRGEKYRWSMKCPMVLSAVRCVTLHLISRCTRVLKRLWEKRETKTTLVKCIYTCASVFDTYRTSIFISAVKCNLMSHEFKRVCVCLVKESCRATTVHCCGPALYIFLKDCPWSTVELYNLRLFLLTLSCVAMA